MTILQVSMADTKDYSNSGYRYMNRYVSESPIKAKRIIEERISQDGKSYKVQWEDSWITADALKTSESLIQEFVHRKRALIEVVLSETAVSNDGSQIFVVRVPGVNSSKTGCICIDGLQGQDLIDKLVLVSNSIKSSDSFLGMLKDDLHNGNIEYHEKPNSSGNSETTLSSNKFMDYDGTMLSEQIKADLNRDNNNYNSKAYKKQPSMLYKCNICGLEFVHRTHLKIHQRTHTGEKPYKCDVCGRRFAQKGNLHVHMKIHTGEKQFSCEYCHKRFITNAQLFVHLRTHTNPSRRKTYTHSAARSNIKDNNNIVASQVFCKEENEMQINNLHVANEQLNSNSLNHQPFTTHSQQHHQQRMLLNDASRILSAPPPSTPARWHQSSSIDSQQTAGHLHDRNIPTDMSNGTNNPVNPSVNTGQSNLYSLHEPSDNITHNSLTTMNDGSEIIHILVNQQ